MIISLFKRHVARLALFTLAAAYCGCQRAETPKPMVGQFPSPMADEIRSHDRIERDSTLVPTHSISGVLPSPVEVYVPDSVTRDSIDLFIHFHGSGYLAAQAARQQDERNSIVTLVVNLGAGSSVYERPFQDDEAFSRMLSAVRDTVFGGATAAPHFRNVVLGAFSAGYGSVRALLRNERSASRIDAVFLMDGLHASYDPEGVVLSAGGAVNAMQMSPFVDFAREAVDGNKVFLFTHSEIFPGTYASTTETADYILEQLSIPRAATLEWGPLGMQQISATRRGLLDVRGFAGNTAPDHIDHVHAMGWWLRDVLASVELLD